MEKYQIIVKQKAESDLLKIEKSGDKSMIKKDRIIYQVLEEPDRNVVIISAMGHY